MLQGRKIVVAVSGSIAAYKIPGLVRLLVKQGAEVKVVLTPAAKDFVSPLVLSTVSRNTVASDLISNDSWTNHVHLGRWADLLLVTPASCNTLAKMAYGLCDNLLLAVYLSAVCPVMIAPAMDEDMWQHPATRQNITTLRQRGHEVLEVVHGELASGLVGAGRMAEPEAIVQQVLQFFSQNRDFEGKSVLVTAGPTYERIDPVRFIGNHSSGKMGIAVAAEFSRRGAATTLVCGPVTEPIPSVIQNVVRVQTAAEMFAASTAAFAAADIAVMAAAVADYTPQEAAPEKIKKKTDTFELKLVKTQDILAQLGNSKQPHQRVIGFALETTNEQAHALQKLHNKNADAIVLNSLNSEGAGFGYDTNRITILDQAGRVLEYTTKSKKEVAHDIVDYIKTYLHV